MKGFAKLKVVENKNKGGFSVVEDVFMGNCVAHVFNPRVTEETDKEIAERIAAALNDDTFISEDDLKELEALARRVQDRSEYGGGLILTLVNMYRNVKGQPEEAVGDQPA